MVRVLAIADEVCDALTPAMISRISPDLVLAAGDLPWDYVEFFASATDVPVVFVPGNHDPAVVKVRTTRSGVPVDVYGHVVDSPRPLGCLNADGTVIQAAGLTIAGLGGSVRYREGSNQYTQRQFRRRARGLRQTIRRADGLDVLLTHAPPRSCGDREDAPHHGIEALADLIEATAPSWHLHGHIHPYGEKTPDRTLGSTTVRNVIPYDVIEIDPRNGFDTSGSSATMVL